ncbi:hypothetical protein Tco_1074308 [Tanacetum coccineum]
MYSTSVLDMVVLFYFLDDQLTNLLPKSCILLDVLLLVSWQLAWSASIKAISAIQESFEYHRPMLMVPRSIFGLVKKDASETLNLKSKKE